MSQAGKFRLPEVPDYQGREQWMIHVLRSILDDSLQGAYIRARLTAAEALEQILDRDRP